MTGTLERNDEMSAATAAQESGVRIAYLDCFSGISGDMCLAALVAAGWPVAELEGLPRRLGLEGVRIEVSDTQRGQFAAKRVEVLVEERQPHRHLHHIEAIIDAAELDDVVRSRAKAVFRKLAEAEATVHGSTIEKVHFHEVGAADAIIDIVGTLVGLQSLGIGRVYASAVPLGKGTVVCEHGTIPIPAPATALLLQGVPVTTPDIEAELVTPTGAALLTSLVSDWSGPPRYRLGAVGVGAGKRDLADRANVMRILIGEPDESLVTGRVAVLETALDDENPQFAAAMIPKLLAAGALDVLLVPGVMKKGRPGLLFLVIADPAEAEGLARMLLQETTTLGVRVRHDERFELPRRSAEVETSFGTVALKVARLPDGGERAVAEFESVREVAERCGRPLHEVAAAALEAWRAAGPRS